MNDGIDTTNATSNAESPVDSYVQKLLAESEHPKWLSRWHVLPGSTNGLPRYQFIDPDGLSAVLICVEKTAEHVQYTLRCRKSGKRVMSSTEWTLVTEYNALGALYERIAEHMRQKQQALEPPPYQQDLFENTDRFARALLKDVRSPSPALRWTQDTYEGSPAFRSDGLGKAGNHVWVIQHHTADGRDPSEVYSLKFERDGKAVLACTETCQGVSEDAELQQLYRALSLKNEDAHDDVPEVDAFNVTRMPVFSSTAFCRETIRPPPRF